MVQVLPLAGPFGQAASAFFLAGALFGDLLLIRLSLTGAYVFLLLGAATGYPRWPGFSVGELVSADGIAWAAVCLVLHGFALARLLWDERKITFAMEDEEQLWRFFYRRGGMQRLEMQQVLKYGRWERVRAGQQILGPWESQQRLCLLVEGLASLHTSYNGLRDGSKTLHSGAIFDKGLLNTFGVYIGQEKDGRSKLFHAVARTDCLLYSWGIEELNTMATQLAPVVGAYWRNFTLCQLGMEFDYRVHAGADLCCATGEPESPAVLQGGRSRDFTDPLRSYEQQRTTLRGLLRWLRRSLSPLLPVGIRHTSLPVSGIMARNRVVAVKASEAWAALSRDVSVAEGEGKAAGAQYCWQDPEQPDGASVHGGIAAYRLLQQLQSMRQIEAADAGQLAVQLSTHGGTTYKELLAAMAGDGDGGGGVIDGCCSSGGRVRAGRPLGETGAVVAARGVVVDVEVGPAGSPRWKQPCQPESATV